jgi:3-keto steroid reductase
VKNNSLAIHWHKVPRCTNKHSSGLGFAICCRLIDEFLATRPDPASLVLIPTARTQTKADDTFARLNLHLDKYCQAAEKVVPGAGGASYSRVTIQPELVDLCDLVSVRRVAKSLRDKYERLDVAILNAGIGGWIGVDWLGALKQFLREGMAIVHRPAFKIGSLGKVVKKQLVNGPDEPRLGEIFCANLFGHYMLVHYLMGVLSRQGEVREAARVVWISTLEAYARTFSLDDMQGIGNSSAYESSKRCTDLVVLTAEAETTAKVTKAFFSRGSTPAASSRLLSNSATLGAEDSPRRSLRSSTRQQSNPTMTANQNGTSAQSTMETTKPKFYLSHPGICLTGIMPIPWILVYAQLALLYIARFFGSQWHTCQPYSGATSMVWLALAEEKTLRDREATKGKWGSAVNWIGSERVKRTEVDGWAAEDGVVFKDLSAFEETGRSVWSEMEETRVEWEQALGEEGL